MRSRSRNTRRIGILILGLFSFLIIASGVVFAGPLFNAASATIVSLSLSPSEEYALLPKSVLASRLKDAEEELVRIRYQAALSSVLSNENAELTKELSLRTSDESGIGRVVSAPPKTHYDTLLVELSNGHRVEKGDLAVFEGVLLGEVVDVGNRAALVELYSAPGKTIDVRAGNPEAIVVAQGLGGGSYVFDVPNDVAIANGDSVISATNGVRIVATVQDIVTDPDKTTKRIYAHTAAALSDIRYVHFERPTVRPGETL